MATRCIYPFIIHMCEITFMSVYDIILYADINIRKKYYRITNEPVAYASHIYTPYITFLHETRSVCSVFILTCIYDIYIRSSSHVFIAYPFIRIHKSFVEYENRTAVKFRRRSYHLVKWRENVCGCCIEAFVATTPNVQPV